MLREEAEEGAKIVNKRMFARSGRSEVVKSEVNSNQELVGTEKLQGPLLEYPLAQPQLAHFPAIPKSQESRSRELV